MNYLTPSELYEKYPALQLIGWTPKVIGQLFAAGLLKGRYNSSNGRKMAFIDENSLFALNRYYNDLKDSEKVELLKVS